MHGHVQENVDYPKPHVTNIVNSMDDSGIWFHFPEVRWVFT